MKNLSFRELSALGSALILAFVAYDFLPYGLAVASGGGEVREMLADGQWRMIDKADHLLFYAFCAVIAIIVLQVIYHVIIAILMRQEAGEPEDERDRMIGMCAQRVAHHLLNLGCIALAVYVIWAQASGFAAAYYLLILLVIAEIAKYFATFVYYRKSM